MRLLLVLLTTVSVGLIPGLTACTKDNSGAEMKRNAAQDQAARDLLDTESTLLAGWIKDAAPGATVTDGGQVGPKPCTGDKEGGEYFTKAWVIEPEPGDTVEVLERFEAAMISRGYSIDTSHTDAARPTIVYYNEHHEVDVTEYGELGVLRFTLMTTCGSAEK